MRSVRIAAIAGFEETVNILGGRVDKVCSLSQVSPDLFSDERYDKFIALDKLAELLMYAAKETKNYHFGLILGKEKQFSMLGILGLLVRDSPDVKSALQALVDNIQIHAQDSISISFSFDSEKAILAIDPISMPYKLSHHVYDLIIGCLLGLMKSICGDRFNVTEIRLGTREKLQLQKYSTLLGMNVRINQTCNEIVFPAEYLDLKLKQIDPQYNALLQDYKIAGKQSGYRTIVKAIVRDILSSNHCNIDYVSHQLNFNKRTLNRKLAIENTTFKDLVGDVKKERAKKLLSQSFNSITKISQELGYSETSSFINAFKSWFGTTPKKWQNEHRGLN